MAIGISTNYADDDSSTDTSTWSGVGINNIALFNGLALEDTDAMIEEASTMD